MAFGSKDQWAGYSGWSARLRLSMTSSGADRFPEAVRRELELKAAARCSAPFCREATSAASADGRVARIGVAAHIAAASPGGPRYDASMSAAERRSSSNGIWLCQDHARLIDVDPSRYSASLLREWKRIAERRPLLSAHGETADLYDLPTLQRIAGNIGRSATSRFVRSWSHDIGLERTWGRTLAQACEALLTEIIFNVFDHGEEGVAMVTLGARERVLTLSYPGVRFGVEEWRKSQSPGGGARVLEILWNLSPAILVNHAYRNGINSWYIAYQQRPDDDCELRLGPRPSDDELDRMAGCSVVRLYVEGGTLTLSEPMALLWALGRRGVTRVAVVDVDETHILAAPLVTYAKERGIEVRFLGVPPAPQ
jgi:hypothetical protein